MFGFGKDKDKKKPPEPAKAPAKPAAQSEPLFPPPPRPALQPAFTPPPQPAPQPAAAPDWRTRAGTTWQAHELGCTEEQLEAAFAAARAAAPRGAPFGGTLWGNLAMVAKNQQAVDDMVDELPNEAFGLHPGEHFQVMLRCWSHMTARANEWGAFRKLAIAGGWRPGDINALQLFEQFGGPPAFLAQAKHPLGLDILPAELVVAPMEAAVFNYLSRLLEEHEKRTVQ